MPIKQLILKLEKSAFSLRILFREISRVGAGYFIKKSFNVYKVEGFSGFLQLIWHYFKSAIIPSNILQSRSMQTQHKKITGESYRQWIKKYACVSNADLDSIGADILAMRLLPKISIIMPTYNSDATFLKEAIESVIAQVYPHWELCIADDASTEPHVKEILSFYSAKDNRIKVTYSQKNGHISKASNEALSLATGDWIGLLDHDDTLSVDALYQVVKSLEKKPSAMIIYSDEDKITETGQRYDPYFKPDWNYELFLSQNLICHFGVYHISLIKKVNGFRIGYEGAQDYDLALRCLDHVVAESIHHIPKVLYHWRAINGSTAMAGSEKSYAADAGERALNDYFTRNHIRATAETLPFGMYRTHYHLGRNDKPLVTIIIPTYNGLHLIKQCVDSVLDKTVYQNYEILVLDNNSDEPETLAYFEKIQQHEKVNVLAYPHPFNYSAINNFGVENADGDYVLLLNNDIEVISDHWLDEMVSYAVQPGVGAVGAKLYYPDDTVQHAGVIVGLGGVAGHAFLGSAPDDFGYFGRARVSQSLSAVTAACLLVKKSIFMAVGGLDSQNLKIAFNDIDFCLKVRELGYRNIWTPFAELYHHESASRGYEDTPEKQTRFAREIAFMKSKWGEHLKFDPAYNINLSLDTADYQLAIPPRKCRF